jgi:hypothetical protein
MSATLLASARDLARAGFAVLPCCTDKRPACAHGWRDATTDSDALARLFGAAAGAALIGVATGAPSRAAVLDIDPAGLGWLDAHTARLPETVRVRTRRGGWHFWFALAGEPPCSAGRIAPGVDTRGAGGYAIAWHAAALIAGRARMAAWPGWLDDLLRPPAILQRAPAITAPRDAPAARRYAVAALRSAVERVAAARTGTRNDALNREAFAVARLLGDGLAEGELVEALAIAAQVAGLAERDARATIASAIRGRGRM